MNFILIHFLNYVPSLTLHKKEGRRQEFTNCIYSQKLKVQSGIFCFSTVVHVSPFFIYKVFVSVSMCVSVCFQICRIKATANKISLHFSDFRHKVVQNQERNLFVIKDCSLSAMILDRKLNLKCFFFMTMNVLYKTK